MPWTLETRDPATLKTDRPHDPNDPLYLEIVAWMNSGDPFPGKLSPLAIFDDWGLASDEERQIIEAHCRKNDCSACFRLLPSWEVYSFDSLIDYRNGTQYYREWYVGKPQDLIPPMDSGPDFISSRWTASPLVRMAAPRVEKPQTPRPSKKIDAGQVVYFIISQTLGLVKIGTSRDVEARLRTMQTGSPDVLYIAATMPGGNELEFDLHRRFASDRTHGEWFNLSDAISEFLNGLGAANNDQVSRILRHISGTERRGVCRTR